MRTYALNHRVRPSRLFALLIVFLAGPGAPAELLERMLAGPMAGCTDLVFAARGVNPRATATGTRTSATTRTTRIARRTVEGTGKLYRLNLADRAV
jgi:hypothetical protein